MADPRMHLAVEPLEDWMASHSPGAKHRCLDCKAPLVEGAARICLACGRPLPPRLAVKREPFIFDKSLAKKLFYESVHLVSSTLQLLIGNCSRSIIPRIR
jgi:hypothetical protein